MAATPSAEAAAAAAAAGPRAAAPVQHSADDWLAQVEELAAMASIFADHFRLLECPGLAPTDAEAASPEDADPEALLSLACPASPAPPIACELLCAVEVPAGGLQLLLDMPADAAGEGAPQGGDLASLPVGEPVLHLPPVRLAGQLPASYPSTSAPAAQLHASWLTPGQARALAGQLEALWHEQGGGGAPILFAWADWVRSEALPHLGLSDVLHLGQGHERAAGPAAAGGGDGRGEAAPASDAVPPRGSRPPAVAEVVPASGGDGGGGGCPDPMQLAGQLLRYNAACLAKDFRRAAWLCAICYDDVPGAQCVRLPGCGHHFCAACVATNCRTQLEAGAVDNMRCPDPGCRLALPPHLLQELLGPELFARWEELLLKRTLDSMSDIVYCPRCEAACMEDGDHLAQCAGCLYAFCSLCGDSYHPPSERCLDPEQRLLVLERRRGRGGKLDAQREADLVNQMNSLRLVQQTSKRCPSCQMAISKTEGCNKMVCSNCSTPWCWRCERAIEGYDHFREGRCNLFDQQEIDRWNRQMWQQGERAHEVEQGQIYVQVMAGQADVTLCRCPVCGQANARQRNNLLRCWACSQHFCAACGGWLRGKVGAHFAIGAPCKQHS